MLTVDSGEYIEFTADTANGVAGGNALTTCSMTSMKHQSLSRNKSFAQKIDW